MANTKLPIGAPWYAHVAGAIKLAIEQSCFSTGKSLHAHVVKVGSLRETALCNHLLKLYCRSHDLGDARKLFEEIPERNLVSYATLICSSCRSGNPKFALDLVSRLRKSKIAPNQFVFSSSISACLKLQSVILGEQLHAQAIACGFEADPFVNSALLDFYSKLGDLESAITLFSRCPIQDAVLLNSMAAAYVSFGAYKEALILFVDARRSSNVKPTEFSFGSLLKACSELEKGVGMQLHGLAAKTGFDSNCFVATSLIDMYGRFGNPESLGIIFDSVFSVDVTLYNAMIGGYLRNNFNNVALEFFNMLILEGLSPNDCTLSSALKASAGLKSTAFGIMIHGVVEKSKFREDLVVNTALIDMYMKCGLPMEGRKVFRCMHEKNTISYNSLISGYGQNGYPMESLALFDDMNRKHLHADLATFVALLGSCFEHEWIIYAHAVKHGFGSDIMVRNTILDALFKTGAVAEALELFDKTKERNVITWTIVISGLAHSGNHSDALKTFGAMVATGLFPNSFTFSSVLISCDNIAGASQGRCIHACGIKHGSMDEFTTSALLDMYAKCGSLEESRRLFDELAHRDIVTWNTMITGYAQHGYGQEALKLFNMMENQGINPNHITFVSLLSACSHCGLVQIGTRLFELMTSKHNIVPSMEHYACMVDLFGRAGMLERAKQFIDDMPFTADISVWTVLLAACKLHGNLALAQSLTDHIMRLEVEDVPTVVLMSNMYAEAGRQHAAEIVRKRLNVEERKEPGYSWVQIAEDPICSYVPS